MLSLVILFAIFLIIISSVNIDLKAFKNNKDNKLIIKIKLLYGLVKLKKELGSFKITKKSKKIDGVNDEDIEVKMKSDSWTKHDGYTDFVNIRKRVEEGIRISKKYKSVITYSIEKINFNTIFWKTEFGFEDAAVTGIATGIANIFMSNLFVIFNNVKNKPKNIHFKIIPDFKKQVLDTYIHCIFTFKIGYIIIAGLKYLRIRYRKRN